MDGFFHRRIKATYHFEKKANQKVNSDDAQPPEHNFKGPNFSVKSLSKNTIFIKKHAGYWCGHW